MFYAVCRHGGLQVRVPVRKDNVMTRCVKCGKALHVDLEDLFQADGVQLVGTGVVCEQCSGKADTRLLVDSRFEDVLLKAARELMTEDAE